MVATEDTQSSDIQNTTDNTGAFEKLKQTLSSSLLTAQDKGKEQKILTTQLLSRIIMNIMIIMMLT